MQKQKPDNKASQADASDAAAPPDFYSAVTATLQKPLAKTNASERKILKSD